MWTFNRVLGGVFDAVLSPFRNLPPLVGLTALAAVASVAILLVFRSKSDQKALRTVKARIHACVFEIRLFKDDLRAIFRAQSEILWHSLRYMRLSLVPMLWVIVPMALMLVQLQFHYGYTGLEVGGAAIAKVRLGNSFGIGDSGPEGRASPMLTLTGSPGIQVDSPMLWIPSLREVDWRIRALAPGRHELTVTVGGNEYAKLVQVSDAVVRRSPIRPSKTLLDQLIYPVEPPLPQDAPIVSIEINYPDGHVGLLGWDIHWMVVFFALTLLFTFALRRPLRVQV